MSEPATPAEGETPVVTEPKTNANPTPATPAVDTAEVERLRKEADQAKMRANQLENELQAKRDAEAAQEAKKLEEQNKFKELYEKKDAEVRELKEAQEKAQKAAELKETSDKIFSEQPAEVQRLAEKVGLSLTDTDDESVEAFKAKLEDIRAEIKAPKVTPNNPGNTQPAQSQMTNQDIADMLRDPQKFTEYLQKNLPGVAGMMSKPQ